MNRYCTHGRFQTKELVSSAHGRESFAAVDTTTRDCVTLTVATTDEAQLDREIEVMKSLEGCKGVPKLLWEGTIAGKAAFAVEEFGPSLSTLVQKKWLLPLGVIVEVAVSLLSTLQDLHKRGFVHLAVHPDNIYLSAAGDRVILSGFHNSIRFPCNPPVSDIMFASTHRLRGSSASPRDDLESLVYLLSYLHKWTLPWLSAHTREGVLLIRSRPEGKQLMHELPVEFEKLREYVFALTKDMQPKYHMLRKKLREAAAKTGTEVSLAGLSTRKRFSRRASCSSEAASPSLSDTTKGPLPAIPEAVLTKLKQSQKTATQPHPHTGDKEATDVSDCETTTSPDDISTLQRTETVKSLRTPTLPATLRKRTV